MKHENSWKRLLISPLKSHKIILGQTLESSICALFEAGILWGISLLLGASYSIDFVTALLGICLLFIAGLLFANIAYFFSLRFPNEVIYETMMNLVVLVLFFLSSALIPQTQMTFLISRLLNLNIFDQVLHLLRSLLLKGGCNMSEYIIVAAIIMTLILLLILINSRRLRKTVI